MTQQEKLTILAEAGVDLDRVMELFGEWDAYEKYLFRLPDQPMMRNAIEAFKKNDYATTQTEVHTLKGVAANLCLTFLVTCCQEVVADLRNGKYAMAQHAMVDAINQFNGLCAAIAKVKADL